jgi:hypothetical protein
MLISAATERLGGYAVAQWFKTLCYKLEGRLFDTR